jgi:hypothetical protein
VGDSSAQHCMSAIAGHLAWIAALYPEVWPCQLLLLIIHGVATFRTFKGSCEAETAHPQNGTNARL